MENSVLRRKLKPAGTQPEPDPAADGLGGVMAKSASVVGLVELEAQLEAHSHKARLTEPAEFIESLPENGLYYRLECEVGAQIGLLCLDPALINALDDVLTGELDEVASACNRAPTAVDEALCRPYLDGMLTEFAAILRELREGKPTQTYQTAGVEREPSPHQFPEEPYLVLALEIDICCGARKGNCTFMIPACDTEFTSAMPRPGENTSSWKAALQTALNAAPASLDVVLYRKQMQIGNILRLKVGDVLEVPARALENLSIESQKGVIRSSLMRARLGEYQEMRAAKVTQIGELASNPEPARLLAGEVLADEAAASEIKV